MDQHENEILFDFLCAGLVRFMVKMLSGVQVFEKKKKKIVGQKFESYIIS